MEYAFPLGLLGGNLESASIIAILQFCVPAFATLGAPSTRYHIPIPSSDAYHIKRLVLGWPSRARSPGLARNLPQPSAIAPHATRQHSKAG